MWLLNKATFEYINDWSVSSYLFSVHHISIHFCLSESKSIKIKPSVRPKAPEHQKKTPLREYQVSFRKSADPYLIFCLYMIMTYGRKTSSWNFRNVSRGIIL